MREANASGPVIGRCASAERRRRVRHVLDEHATTDARAEPPRELGLVDVIRERIFEERPAGARLLLAVLVREDRAPLLLRWRTRVAARLFGLVREVGLAVARD